MSPTETKELEAQRQEMMAEHEQAGQEIEMWADMESEDSHAMVEHYVSQQSSLSISIKGIEEKLARDAYLQRANSEDTGSIVSIKDGKYNCH